MKKYLILPAFYLLLVFSMTSCWWRTRCNFDRPEPKATLKEQIQGKTYKALSVKKGSTDVTTDFRSIKISFSADGYTFLYQNDASATPVSSACNMSTTTMQLSVPPTNWSSTLTEALASEQGNTFEFKVNILNSYSGPADYVFKMQRQ